MVNIVVYFQNIKLRVVVLHAFKPLPHIRKNTIVKNLTPVLRRKNQVIFTTVYTMALFPVLHRYTMTGSCRERYNPELSLDS
jgi:hypothetical protein